MLFHRMGLRLSSRGLAALKLLGQQKPSNGLAGARLGVFSLRLGHPGKFPFRLQDIAASSA